MKKVRIGVIGCGSMGKHHIRILSELKEAKLVGIYDVDLSLSQEVALSFNTKAFGALELLLPEVEALSLASPTSTHFELGLKCIRASKHLLVEKPLALNSTDALSLATEARNKGLVLAAGMIERFNPAYLALKRQLKNDKVLGISIKRFSPFPERITDASVVMDMMIHDLDLALDLSSSDFESLKAEGRKVKTDKFDEVVSKLFFRDGLIITLKSSRVKDSKLRSIITTNNKAIYEADLLSKKLYRRSFEKLSEKIELETKPADQLTQELRDFLVSIRRMRPALVSGDQGARALKLAEEVEKQCL